MSRELVERLRSVPKEVLVQRFDGVSCDVGKWCHEAAAALEASAPEGYVLVSKRVADAVAALVPLLEDGWDEYDDDEDQRKGSAAIDELIAAYRASPAGERK